MLRAVSPQILAILGNPRSCNFDANGSSGRLLAWKFRPQAIYPQELAATKSCLWPAFGVVHAKPSSLHFFQTRVRFWNQAPVASRTIVTVGSCTETTLARRWQKLRFPATRAATSWLPIRLPR
jgi:hypothetical protein